MSTENHESAAIAKKVRELMERHGVGERQQSGELGRVLDLGFSAAHRKMNGESPWSLSQIIQVASHYNESPSALIDSITVGKALLPSLATHEATLVIATKEFSCLVQIGDLVRETLPAKFVAYIDQGQWRVVQREDAQPGPELYTVEKIEIYPSQARKLTIAVIDDEIPTANNVRDYLNDIGFKATAFYTLQNATTALRNNAFDGYVVDWFFEKETSEDLLKLIRASENPNAPVILLTGQMETGMVTDKEVAALMRRFNVLPQEKPARLPIIGVEISKMLGLN